METWTISPEQIPALLEGLAILGNGGGGSPAWGRKILENDLRRGRSWKIVDPEAVPDDWTIVSGGILASVKALEAMTFDDLLSSWEARFPTLEVVQLTERWMGKSIEAFVPFEPGGLNSPLVLTLSARSRLVAVDGDGLGRACPESQMTSFIGHGISLTPMPLISRNGDAVLVVGSVEPTLSDELGRWLVSRSGGMGANTLYPMSGAQLKASVIPGTYSRSLEIGAAVLRARAGHGDPLKAVREAVSAIPLFQGRIDRMEEQEKLGFFVTLVRVEGAGEHRNRVAQITIKNEAMLLTIDGELRAMFPDSIFMLEPATGRGYMSIEMREGMEIALMAAPAHPRLRHSLENEVGYRSLGPARYGYPELEYQSLEALNP